MPVRVVDCDPALYLFLIRHPDVVVNIWEVLKLSNLELQQTEADQFQLKDSPGTVASLRLIYQSRDTHVVYGEGSYEGALLPRAIKGRGVLVLKSGFIRETNGRCYVTSRLDSFLTIEPAGAELVTKTVSPLLGKTADNNFIQTVAFVGSLSHTAEVNDHGMQRLASQLKQVPPEVREEFAELAQSVWQRAAADDQPEEASRTQMAAQPNKSRQN